MYLINFNAQDKALLQQLITHEKTIETRGKSANHYRRLKGETIGFVKTGTNDNDNGCIIAVAKIIDIVDLSTVELKEKYVEQTKIDSKSPFYKNASGLLLEGFTALETPIKVKVFPSNYYTYKGEIGFVSACL